VHSKVREAVLGEKLNAVASGHSAYRFLIDAEKLRQDSDLAFLVEKGGITTFVGLDRRIVAYPCRNLELLNIVAILPDKLLLEESVESWNVKGSIDDMLKSFAEFDPVIKRIFRYISTILSLSIALTSKLCHGMSFMATTRSTSFKFMDQGKNYYCRRCRSCHASSYSPLHSTAEYIDQGQGGSQAIEDAEAIMVALEDAKPEDVAEQLKKAEKVRYERASFVQKCSREMAQGPGKAEDGKQGVLNGYRFAQVNPYWFIHVDLQQYINSYKGAREEFRKLDEQNGKDETEDQNGL